MRRAQFSRYSAPTLLVGLVWITSFARAENGDLATHLKQAEFHEKNREWDKACECYEAALLIDKSSPSLKARYQHSLQRYWQRKRHEDINFRKEVLGLDYAQALKLHAFVRDTLLDKSLDKRKVDPAKLFKKGLEELDHALADPDFRQKYLPNTDEGKIEAFREEMKAKWSELTPNTRKHAADRLSEVAIAAKFRLDLQNTVTVMEFTCGACYAIDNYTLYLTPNQLRELYDSLHGEMGDVGVTLGLRDGKVVVAQVDMMGSAARPNAKGIVLAINDRIITIDNTPLDMFTPDQAQALLQGPAGSFVELSFYRAGEQYKISLQRQPILQASVYIPRMPQDNIGFLKITNFQDSTAPEVDEALAQLSKQNVQALVLDLRGNTGGVFQSAIDVAARFIAKGVITTRASVQELEPKSKDFNKVFNANNPDASTLPMVVLIDGDTASAAEVLVGALKDHKRARLVGQTTFGKGCTQVIIKLREAPGNIPTGGLRVTVTRFYSPLGTPYTGQGVVPDLFSPAGQQEQDAYQEVLALLKKN